ncbi:glycosyltransferase [Silicimonas algicola]|uniref:Glycosyltransferase involved in cell wall biosynthesis n=1 Tax=Silicimonas algicola TaxID=1826607 RepID=A0A316GB56_9RHOB|nr:glycosyltransferase [Silicimonas algicola]AZQ65918.1 glycosyltransferase [Silicimonas algicola]PWK58199.1 glycosyltransferase involved in cell wall biosynthesis [Silicimonas algicola]
MEIVAEHNSESPSEGRRGTVVLVIDGLGRGGAERLLALYAPAIRALGYRAIVVTLQVRDGNAEAEKLRAAGIAVRHVELTKLRNVTELRKVIACIREPKPSVIHTHLEAATVVGGIASAVLRVPAVTTLHTLEHPTGINRASFRLWVLRLLLTHIYDRVLCLSDTIADEAREHGLRRAPLVTLPNGILPPESLDDRCTVRKRLRAELGISEGALVVVTVAVLRPPKGVDRLLAAMSYVLASVPDAILLVVGDGSEREQLEQQTRDQGIAHRVVFTGFREDVYDLLRSSDLFVLPTLWDTLPTVVIEAMFASLPIVASRVGGIPDMVEHGVQGALVPPGDVPALASAILGMLTDARRRETIGLAALRRAETDFSLSIQVQKLADLYDEVIAGVRPPS